MKYKCVKVRDEIFGLFTLDEEYEVRVDVSEDKYDIKIYAIWCNKNRWIGFTNRYGIVDKKGRTDHIEVFGYEFEKVTEKECEEMP